MLLPYLLTNSRGSTVPCPIIHNVDQNIQPQPREIMTQKCYRVEYTAHLHKLTLALRLPCDIEIIWKRGEKTAHSGKAKLSNGQAHFNTDITISCNMAYSPATKLFKQKVTKFSVILTSEKGTKQAGEIQFDVAEYINQRELSSRDYECRLAGCPDKNARLTFGLVGKLIEEVDPGNTSERSYANGDLPISQPGDVSVSSLGGTSGMMKKQGALGGIEVGKAGSNSASEKTANGDRIKGLEEENRRIMEQLKAADKLRAQNEELRKKIKNEEYKKSLEIKQKIEKYKTEIEKIKAEIRANKKIEEETQAIERDILKCKIKIMKAFNYAAEAGDDRLVDSIQDYCGILEK